MSEWKKVKIGDFITECEGRYKPDNEKISKYKRLDKIDFSGTIHISDKPSKTDMIIVHPGDLVISGINVAKNAQKTMPKINQETVVNTMIPLPPLKEQEEIVNKVETLLAKVDELKIQDRKSLSNKLIFGIIKENLEG